MTAIDRAPFAKDPIRTLIMNSGVLFGIKLFMPLSFLMISVLIARLLGVREFGVYATVVSYYTLFRILSSFGVDSFLLREIPRDPSLTRHYLRHAFLLNFVFSLANAGILNFVLFAAGYSDEIRACGFMLSLALLPDSLNRLAEASFTAHHRSWLAFFTVLVREAVKLVLAVTAIAVYRSLEAAMAAIVVSYYAGFLANIFVLPRVFGGGQGAKFDNATFSRMIRVSMWIGFVGGMNSLFLSTDIFVLSKMSGEATVGYYNAAGRFLVLAFLFIDSFGTALFPFLSRLHRESEAQFKKLAQTAMRWLTAGSFLFIALVYCFSGFWVRFLFGSEFEPSDGLLRIMIWAVVFLANSYFLGRTLFIANAQKYDFIAVSAACAVNAVSTVYCTYHWGAAGTAWAMVISVIFLCSLHWVFFRAKVFRPDTTTWLLPAAGGAVFFGLYFLLARWNVYGAFAAAVSGYALFLIKSRVLKIEGMPS